APGPAPIQPFRLIRFLKWDVLSPEDRISCWRVIDHIYDNLVDANGVTRSLPALEQWIGHPLRNPILSNNAILAGINFPAEVHSWCSERREDGVLDEAIAQLGQSKPFLVGLEQCLTVQERDNRHSTSREKAKEQPEHPPIPQNLFQSNSDVLAFCRWYRSLTSRPVEQNQADVIGNFHNRAQTAQLLMDAINNEPENMVENANNTEEHDPSEEDNAPQKTHPQVLKVRHISPLSKLALSWELLKHLELKVLGTPPIVPYNNETYPKGDRAYNSYQDRVDALRELLSRSKAAVVNAVETSYLARAVAHPKHEISIKVTNKSVNKTRTRQVQAGQKVLKAAEEKKK
ncbi:hypothetical protein B0T20DRAFT_332814, partial [Sordaria brevicollis]